MSLDTLTQSAGAPTTSHGDREQGAAPQDPDGGGGRAGRAAPSRLALRLALLAGVGGAALAAGAAVAVAAATLVGSPMSTKARPITLPGLDSRSTVYAADGSVLAVLHADQDRVPVTLAQVPPVVQNAVVDTEDAQFWKEGAVSARSAARALITNLNAGGIRQGGSTITQQLVKNTLLSSKQDLHRKIQEAVLAMRLEKQLTKGQILERYLNTVYFGNGAYGVQAAAEHYFGIPVGQLQPDQAALLAGLIRNPVGYDPIRDPGDARARRSVVLGLMVQHGHLAADQQARAEGAALPTAIVNPPAPEDYFTAAVKDELLGDRRLGATPQERFHAVFGGGLAIHTTLDPGLQQRAADTVRSGLPDTGGRLTAALVSIEPASGAVRALVGGPDFHHSQFNLALDGIGRQPGSSFKPFTLVTALEKGYSPNDTIDGTQPCSIPNPGGTPDPWRPGNFEGEGGGVMTLTDATAHSINCAYAQLALMVGSRSIADVAHAMGITARLNPVPSMTLGTEEVTPLQMASAYSTLAADGVHHTAHLVDHVDGPDGKTLFRTTEPGRRAVPAQISREAVQVMRQVVIRGTGRNANLADRPVAGKTGTAENFHDAWFVGYTPQLSTAVWMGDPAGEVPMTDVGGISVVGGSFPARIWRAFMEGALAGRPALDFPEPDPGQVPAGQFLADGVGRGPNGGSTTGVTTWCWASCGKAGPTPANPPAGAPPPAPPAPAPGKPPKH